MAEFDPYEILGVERDAGAEEIKKAHRRRAKATHPDTGGDRDSFESVSKAMQCLSDPVRRKAFDDTGRDPGHRIDTKMERAIGLIASLMTDVIEGDADPVTEPNLLGLMKDHLRSGMDRISVKIMSLTMTIRRGEKMMKRMRLREDGSRDVVREVLQNAVHRARDALQKAEEDSAVHAMAIEILDRYDFDADTPPMVCGIDLGNGDSFTIIMTSRSSDG